MISYAHYDAQLPKTHLADHIEVLSILPGGTYYEVARAKSRPNRQDCVFIGDLRECLTQELENWLFSSESSSPSQPPHCSTISIMGKRNKGKAKQANKERQAAAAKEQQEALEAQIAQLQIGDESTDAIDLVRYCSDECQRDHKPYHKEACKNQAAELRDELLFKQPESTHLGDCPICMIPLYERGFHLVHFAEQLFPRHMMKLRDVR
eukprot:scaffold1057_cov203-Skeletonema_marinoi.AAC.12